jgi:hypothetical protein
MSWAMRKLPPNGRMIRQALFHHIGGAGCPEAPIQAMPTAPGLLAPCRRSGTRDKRSVAPRKTRRCGLDGALPCLFRDFAINDRVFPEPAFRREADYFYGLDGQRKLFLSGFRSTP